MEHVAPARQALAEANRQRAEYQAARAANPSRFGHTADGRMDGTPEHGPAPLVIIYLKEAPHTYAWRLFWHVHKWSFPMEFHYCYGHASDSRGERTDILLGFDIRDLPKRYIGRFQLHGRRGCSRRTHQTIIARACADGFDFTSTSWASGGVQTPIKQIDPLMVIDDSDVPF